MNFEIMNREDIELLQLKRLKKMIDYCIKNVPFYRERLRNVGIMSGNDIKYLADIKKIPFTTNKDLEENYPYGLLAIDKKDIFEIHESSGSTGVPKVMFYSCKDLKNWSIAVARLLSSCGIQQCDVLQNATSYGMFTGGFGSHYGARKMGCTIVPSSGGNINNQIRLMSIYGVNALVATASYVLRISEEVEKKNCKNLLDQLNIVWTGAEACTFTMRNKIEKTLGVDLYNSYGLTEFWGPGFSGECMKKNGLHVNEDMFYVELIDPKTNESLENGEIGELVVTSLVAEAMPILRYKTHDLTKIFYDKCECGRTTIRVAPPYARTDDMFVLKGVNIYPFIIEKILSSFEALSTHYVIELHRKNGVDKAIIKVELNQYMMNISSNEKNNLTSRIVNKIFEKTNVHFDVEILPFSTLLRTNTKERRIIDLRYDTREEKK